MLVLTFKAHALFDISISHPRDIKWSQVAWAKLAKKCARDDVTVNMWQGVGPAASDC